MRSWTASRKLPRDAKPRTANAPRILSTFPGGRARLAAHLPSKASLFMQKIPALALSAALAVAACSTGTPSNAATDSAALDTSGAQPATAMPFTFASGVRPCAFAYSAEQTSSATACQDPSGSLRRTVEKRRTRASRPITEPSWNQRPSFLMTMSISPLCAGFQRCTGGRPRPGACFAAAATSSSRDFPWVSAMTRKVGAAMARLNVLFPRGGAT